MASSILKFCRRKDLSNDTQIRLIGSVEPEIYTKMLRNMLVKKGQNNKIINLHNKTVIAELHTHIGK